MVTDELVVLSVADGRAWVVHGGRRKMERRLLYRMFADGNSLVFKLRRWLRQVGMMIRTAGGRGRGSCEVFVEIQDGKEALSCPRPVWSSCR